MTALVGYTGFVGSNLYLSAGKQIQSVYNSKNIAQAYGTKPELLIYAGLRAEKYLANHAPDKDWQLIVQAEENIRRINPKKLVLISTIDIFRVPRDVDENTKVDTEGLAAYGYNRYQLELWAREAFPDALIIRLPGLFGANIKKNFIYDYMNVIPFMLSEQKLEELSGKDPQLKAYYELRDNGFYRVKNISEAEKKLLKEKFRKLDFSALSFTDSRSKYQFYNLGRLWDDMQTALQNDLRIWHPATEPVSAGELYEFLTGKKFVNELAGVPADYDYKTVYGGLFGGSDGYICDKRTVVREIRDFVGRSNG